ncbi:MAG: DNA cytosine methyltransferase, partial [Gammaproteobacteria bacterium]|nr:DNA cytosine methyltransferase [Gammaproteobacteria bacterium]
PSYAIFENVTALLSGERGKWFERVLWDISQVGYDAEWHCVPASELGAHHHRDRVWIVAYPRCEGIQQRRRLPNAVKKSELANGVFRDGLQAVEIKENEILADPDSQPSEINGWNKSNEGFSGRRKCNAEGGRNNDRREFNTKENGEMVSNPEHGKGGRIFSGREIARAYSDNRGDRGIWQAEPDVGRVADGIPNRSHRLKQLGNSVVPQIPELIGRAIM